MLTPSINAGIDNVSGASLTGSYLVDVVSAASADIVSTASNRWQEVRQAGSLGAQYKPHDFGVGVGGSVSSEPDYLSYGFFATMVKDFDEKNWTLTGGFGYSHDTAGRCGANGKCTPFSVFSRDLQRARSTSASAWVVDRASLASLTADLVLENGDQSKVYRYIPMFSPAAAALAASAPSGASASWVNGNRLPERPLEQLPLERHRFALTARYAHRFDGSTVRLEERFYDDDWGLIASTTDARWIFDLGKRFAALAARAPPRPEGCRVLGTRVHLGDPGGANGDALEPAPLPHGRPRARPAVDDRGRRRHQVVSGKRRRARKWQLGFSADAMYTAYIDDLYMTSRSGYPRRRDAGGGVVMRLRLLAVLALLPLAIAAAAPGGGCPAYDPMHDQEVAALGGEAPGVSPGPDAPPRPAVQRLPRRCRSGAPAASASAGTVYQYSVAPSPAASGSRRAGRGRPRAPAGTATTNSAGNFYVLQSDWAPTYPLTRAGHRLQRASPSP